MSNNNLTLSSPIFNNEEAARHFLESQRWPDGRICPHCGVVDESTPLEGKKHRPGLYQCNACRKQFSVTVGTIFERSKVPLHKWLLATHMMTSSKKGVSAHQIHRTIGVTYKTAWFLCHRIREAMREPNPDDQIGGGGSTVEADETFWGTEDKYRNKPSQPGTNHKIKIFSLVDRSGKARSFHVPNVRATTLRPILKEQLKADTKLYTDKGGQYRYMHQDFPHDTVDHGIGEYVRGDVHTNTVEGYFSIMKRGLNGVYQHVSEKHLKRYLGEFDFRYSYRQKLGFDDLDRTKLALKGIEGKRLTYRTAT